MCVRMCVRMYVRMYVRMCVRVCERLGVKIFFFAKIFLLDEEKGMVVCADGVCVCVESGER